MKKIMFVAMAFAAVCFTSCGNKSNSAAVEGDSAVVESAVAPVEELIGNIEQAVAAGEVEGTNDALAKIQEVIGQLVKEGKSADAQVYIDKLNEYISQNLV